ncbi:tannase and feruloyl esterase [Aspergillus heteromorphus CBS 117.55]|uniref:Carboxylic ester hydrolase n=1 Tax=Aspergillus heteromorphus CBS 117.55 TaxID=1448321 RepID=A0A317V2W0_9EURO|nr:tannase and feruloyl esterase [Aspergillus heteromorphus CBS 117.55]PWY68614.1 tannase and feruloyl esterase [Aspergillus heteromorphus CBS 117.55]
MLILDLLQTILLWKAELENYLPGTGPGSSVGGYQCSPDSIKTLLPAGSKVLYASHYQADATFTPPKEHNAGAFRASSFVLPRSACVFQANLTLPGDTQHSVGVVLPDDWNGRFMTAGNGGFSGSVSWGSVVDAAWYGFAAISTNTGHESSGAEWAYQNEEALKNWGYRAMHNAVVNGKSLTENYYGKDISYSYYRGCSAGGKQGLKEVEMFPNDFDGVIAGAPAWWTTRLQLWNMIVGIWNSPADSPHHLSNEHLGLLAQEVIRQCDPQDGVKDNMVMDPSACDFRPEELMCGDDATDKSTCLNPQQVKTVHKLHSDWVEDGKFIFPHLTMSSEYDWRGLVAAPANLGTDYVKWMLQLGGNWTWEDWNADLIKLSDELNPGNATADNYDLSPFYNKGGKLIHYHGWSDWSIATGSSIYFYDQVTAALQPKGIDLDDFYRFFLVPGMGHCAGTSDLMNAPWAFAGDGQSSRFGKDGSVHSVPGYEDARHDVVLAMMNWVENGTSPDELIATKFVNDRDPQQGVYRQRPLCVHPAQAQYKGTGDINAADSWECKKP